MDPFADLGRPSGSSSARSGTPVSRNGTPKLGDSFADLASLAGARGTTRNNVNSMTLEQRQKLNAENKLSSSSSSVSGANNQSDSWADLDLLSGGIKVSAPTESIPNTTTNINSNSNGGQDDNIDELFDVFNRPPPAPTQAPPPSQQSPAIPSSSSRTSASAQQSPRSNSLSQSPESRPSSPKASKGSRGDDPRDGKIAELVEMGFSVEQSKRALANTDTGLDVRQAIDFLMREAHEKSRGNSSQESTRPSSRESSRPQRAQQGTPPAPPDLGKLAQDFSAQFISKAGSFWNQSRKNIARAIEQYNTGPANDGTPAWMRDRERYLNMEAAAQRERREGPVTEEAATLESHESQQRARRAREDQEMPKFPTSRARTESPAWMDSHNGHNNGHSDKQPARRERSEQRAPEPRPSSSGPNRAETKPVGLARTRGFKFNDEEETYISPARRKGRPDSKPASPAPAPASAPAAQVRPKQPKVSRAPVEISSAASQAAQAARTSGNESFKRGDFSEAATSYGQALKHIPPKHLSRTIVLSNRATCFMKLGDNKAALADAEEGIVLIGQSFGEGEEAEPGKGLKDIWAKLVTRKAEASEQLEKFSDALTAWTLLLNNGFSSKSSIEGKRRCKEALDPKPKSAAPSKVPSRMPSRAQTPSQASQEALNRVRQANQAAEKADAEKYQLLDSVDARINGWKDGKEDNIRALLASLDTVLWPELEWKTISMADLLVPKKVKIAYMKAAAKTHPDKISTDTETEKKMIAQAVFVTLNRAWESFKQENNMS